MAILTIIVSVLIALFLFVGVGYVVFKAITVSKLKVELDKKLLETQAHIDHIQSVNLNQIAEICELQKRAKDERNKIADERNEVENLIKQNEHVYGLNQICLYDIKESAINIIKDYDIMLALLSKIVKDEIPYHDTYNQIESIRNKKAFLENNFNLIFRQTPQDYVRAKGKIRGTDFSIN